MEIGVVMRIKKSNKGEPFKEKNADSVRADKMFLSLVMKHKSGALSDDEYFNEVVNKFCEWGVPHGIVADAEVSHCTDSE